ncbi:CinA family protein [Hymenobacter persicinus]|uniref:Nicotinamide-nucleotide amidohydrolase family protein n=1 Tax=Hymenobacter persicinus TaxID=2025506 RepID=A0A4Q5LFP8_9BACT|nr:nicotinamide-nucleotide amidohydrolase family protein [Hymenobacter persicinus]RYU82171.1 nicotinamide-nucleotide amidohydrolase family protein [Hymenobacter persicinus]
MKTPDLNALIKQFLQHKLKLALAESCTCGLVAAQLAPTEGIGEVLLGSVVTYHSEAKQRLLGVKKKTLTEYSAESQQTTNEMAQGLHRQLPTADVCVAITGLFGPGASEQADKPVGTIFVTILFEGRAHEYREQLKGSTDKLGLLAADFIYTQLGHLLDQRQQLALNTPLSTKAAK